MSILFPILSVFTLLVLAAGVICLALGFSRGSRALRFTGIGLTVLFALLSAFVLLSAFARL